MRLSHPCAAQAEKILKRAKEADPANKHVEVRLKQVQALNKDVLKDSFGGMFKKVGYKKAAAIAEKGRVADDGREFRALRQKYERHIREVLQRCLKHTGGDYDDYAEDVKKLADAGAQQADTKNKDLHESLKPVQKTLWKLFYVAARRHEGFRITPQERESCDACHVDVPSNEMLAFEKKHGPPEWLKNEKDPMAKDLEIHEEMRDAMEDKDEKSQWEKMMKVREKMGKGPPVMLPYESKEKTDQIIAQVSGNKYDPNMPSVIQDPF